jgi:predicted outer membrane repeat protein/parallel beta-helix repeat protein
MSVLTFGTVNTVKGTIVRIDDTTAAAGATGIAGAGLNRAGRRAESRRLRRAGAALAVVPAALGTTALLVGGTAIPAGAATLTVTSLDDSVSDGTCDADCTLRDALGDANDGDTIVFAAGLTGDYDITSTLTVNDAVTIQGPGAGVVAIDGTDTYAIFELNAGTGEDVTISGLTLKNGNAGNGAAIYNDDEGDLTVDGVVFDGNDTSSGGGAIWQNAGVLTVLNSTFTGNTSVDYGGAIYANYLTGPLTITGSTFTGNESTGQGGGAVAAFYDDDTEVFDLIVTDSTFTGNTAADVGGAIYAYELNDVTITGSTFTGNESPDQGGGALKIYGGDDNAVVTITETTISGNTAADNGGGLYVSYVVDLTITGSTITDNTADGNGGGVYAYSVYGDISITDSTISGNSAGYIGGGFYLGSDIGAEGGSVTITRTTIANNTAVDEGGGLYLYDVYVPVTVRNSTISGNTAEYGGGIYFSSSQGGATAALIIENSTISGNSASVDGGGIWFGDSAYDLELVMTTITANTAAGDGDGIYFNVPEVPGAAAAKAPRADRTGPKGTATPRPTRERGPRASVAGTQSATGTIIWGNGTEDLGGTATLTSTKNVIGTKAAGITVTGTALATDPLLGPLTDNGGPTQTHALLVGSPAIDAGPTPVPTFPGNEYDQRGPDYTRAVNGTTDIGAYEVQPPDPEVITFTG